jgi:hypothetical protein
MAAHGGGIKPLYGWSLDNDAANYTLDPTLSSAIPSAHSGTLPGLDIDRKPADGKRIAYRKGMKASALIR